VRAHVLAVILFLGFWVVLGLGMFFMAIRGGPRGVRQTLQTQSRSGRKAVGIVFAIIYVGFGVALPVALLTGNHANASSQFGGIKLTIAEKRGRVLFGQQCGVCHTLAAANAVGEVGPNLDMLRPPAALVVRTLMYGCLQNAPPSSPQACLGQGTMPPDIIEGRDAQQVADFVAKVAGKE
jgi:mono/diheme cytochrome c family protein